MLTAFINSSSIYLKLSEVFRSIKHNKKGYKKKTYFPVKPVSLMLY